MAVPDTATCYFLIAIFVTITVGVILCLRFCDGDDDDLLARAKQPAAESAEQRADQPAPPPPESEEQRLARVWAEREALAARAEVVLAQQALAARTGVALTGQQAAAAAPVQTPLPYFPYTAAQGDSNNKPSETVAAAECAICLEALRPGQLCSEVPLCRHVFHSGCLEQWGRSNGSCPLCRAKIVPGSDEVAIADDMV